MKRPLTTAAVLVALAAPAAAQPTALTATDAAPVMPAAAAQRGPDPLPADETASPAMAVAIANKSRAKTAPRLIEGPSLVRPEAARMAGEFGEVVLSGIVTEDGRLREAKVAVSSRSAIIDATALEAAPAMTFEPARDATGAAVSIPANLPLEFSHTDFRGPRGLAKYRCEQFVRDYDWWRRTWPADKHDRVYATLRGYAVVADMNSGTKIGDFADEWRQALEACRVSPNKVMLDVLKPHGLFFRGLLRE